MKTRYWLLLVVVSGWYCGVVGLKTGRGERYSQDMLVLEAHHQTEEVMFAAESSLMEMQDSLNVAYKKLEEIKCQ